MAACGKLNLGRAISYSGAAWYVFVLLIIGERRNRLITALVCGYGEVSNAES